MKPFLIAALIIATSLLSSCKKVKTPENTAELMGEWKVVTVNNGWGGVAKSDGKTTYKFTKHWKCYVFENHILKSTRSFQFTKTHSIYSIEQEYIIDFDKGTDYAFKISGNTLQLSAEAYDGGGYELTRK